MTLYEISYDLLETIRNAKLSDDESIDHRLMWNWIHNQRALWLTRKLNNIRDYDDNLIQTINVELEYANKTTILRKSITNGLLTPNILYTIKSAKGSTKADFRPCGALNNKVGTTFTVDVKTNSRTPIWGSNGVLEYDVVIPTDRNILLKSKTTLPATLELNYGNAVLEVTSPDLLTKEFSFVPFNQLRFSGEGRFNTKQLFCAIRDNYWFIKYGKDNLTYNTISNIIVRAIFQDPTKVPGYNINTSNYPINRHILDFMKEQIIKSNLQVVLSTKSDEYNDGSGTIK